MAVAILPAADAAVGLVSRSLMEMHIWGALPPQWYHVFVLLTMVAKECLQMVKLSTSSSDWYDWQ